MNSSPLSPLSAAGSAEIPAPVKPWVVVLTLGLALLANVLPAMGVWQAMRPDFLALMLLYWCIQVPQFIGIFGAWTLGIVMDVADADLFGQHALAYALLAYGAGYFRRRVLRFSLWAQALHVAALLTGCQAVVLLVRLFAGAAGVSWTYFAASLSGALLWPALSVLLQLRQRPSA